MRLFRFLVCFASSALVCAAVSAATPLEAPSATASSQSVAAAWGRVPLSFELNRGQAPGVVRFLSRGSGYGIFLTRREAVIRLGAINDGRTHSDGRTGIRRPRSTGDLVLRLRLVGMSRNPRITGLSRQEGRSNYLLGSDSRKWRRDIPSFGRVRYEGVYPGIDLVYHGNQRQLEYDFVLAAGADPRSIALEFDGARSLTVDAGGDLVVHTDAGNLVQRKPVVYQKVDGVRRAVECRYTIAGDSHRAGFRLDRYDRTRALVIDPTIAYSTFLGGSGNQQANGITVDANGNAYIAGTTSSATFPGVGAGSLQPHNAGGEVEGLDAFVIKLNAAGTGIVYSTFLGGNEDDEARGIAIDPAGNAYLLGVTTSGSFPGVTASSIQTSNAGGDDDTFVTKLNAAGNAIVYSTLYGGSGADDAAGIAVDGAGNAYITGITNSASLPGISAGSLQPTNRQGGGDGFVAKINPLGSGVVWATFLGGSAMDEPGGIALDANRNVYVTGGTTSSDFPGIGPSSLQRSLAGGADVFVTKIDGAGHAIVYSTYLGGSGDELAFGIAVDTAGSAYLAGITTSATLPGIGAGSIQRTNAGGEGDGFVLKLNAAGSSVVYSTFLGGAGAEAVTSIAVNAAGEAYVTGVTDSTSFPGVNASSIQPANGGGGDSFLTKINAAGSAILFSTFLGGAGLDASAADALVGDTTGGQFIAVDTAGNAYVVGKTQSATFPGVGPGSLQAINGSSDSAAFATKISFAPTTGCSASATALCLLGNRFRVQVAWSVPAQGTSGVGMAIPVTSDTGYFWFFSSNNVELVIKVLDGRAVNQKFWVFYGALSDVHYTITVTDTLTAAVRTYDNPSGHLASVADTSAFDGGSANASPMSDGPTAPSVDSLAASDAQRQIADSLASLAHREAGATAACTADATSLCLNGDRFRVRVAWQVPAQGTSGNGMAVPITGDTGYFWFFSSNNVELVIKALDGRAVDGKFWIFYGALSDVHYTITVTDTQTGAVKTYTNPSGQLASVADTSAF